MMSAATARMDTQVSVVTPSVSAKRHCSFKICCAVMSMEKQGSQEYRAPIECESQQQETN
jgi:hypothetical protein